MKIATVIIRDATVIRRRVGDNTFESQKGILATSDDEALGIEVSLPRDAEPYKAGTYHIAGQSFDRDQYGRPTFGKRGLYLTPVAASQGAGK